MAAQGSYVDGKAIVVADKTSLPPRCIKTNQPINESEYTILNLPYKPPWLILTVLISPVILIFWPFIVRKRCRIKAGLSRSVRRRYLFVNLSAIALLLLAFVIPGYGAITESRELLVAGSIAFVPLLWGAIVLLMLFKDPLKVSRYSDGLYWVEGCSPEYLKSLH